MVMKRPMLTPIVRNPIPKIMARLIFSRNVGNFKSRIRGNGNIKIRISHVKLSDQFALNNDADVKEVH
jgi:hypothetical protein